MGKKKILSIERPDLLKEWDYEKNASICSPEEITLGSSKKVWWVCSRGHEWQATVSNRANNNSGCPYCSGRRPVKGINDFATEKPFLLTEWDYEKNEIDPSEISAKSGKKVWWKCSKCGKEWQSSIASRGMSLGCRECALIEGGKKRRINSINNGELSVFMSHPDLAEEWNYEKNTINPEEITASYYRKVWWKCAKGHEWQQTPSVRSRGIGCPYCSGRLAIPGENDLLTVDPELAKEWDYEKNKGLSPDKVKPNSSKKVWWRCAKGHEWQATVSNRRGGRKCPYCSQALKTSLPEQIVLFYLSKLFKTENRIKIKGYEVDIFLPDYNVAIEYDGIFYHSNDISKEREKRKNQSLREKGIVLYRIKESSEQFKIVGNNIYYPVDSSFTYLDRAIIELIQLIDKNKLRDSNIDINISRDRLVIKEKYWDIALKHNLGVENAEIASEWNYKKNGNLTPEMFTPGSQEMVWWVCNNGHEWKAAIASRVAGTGCPYCSGRKAVKGVTDAETLFPHLSSEWDKEKNIGQELSDFSPYSNAKVWWKCAKGHEWQTTVTHRTTYGTGCPYCSGRIAIQGVNDFASTNPDIAKEWNYKKNGIIPADLHPGSHIKVWWKCSNCGYEWRSSIEHRVKNNTGCPACSGNVVVKGINDLVSCFPTIANEYDEERNPIPADNIHKGSNKRVWWKCSKCGYSWATAISHRTGSDKTGCPKCAGIVGEKIRCIEENIIFDTLEEAAKYCNGGKGNIVACCRGRRKTAYGYHWEYVNE